MKSTVSVSDLVVDSFVKDSRQKSEPKENDDFTFFPDIIDKTSFADDDEFGICVSGESPINVNAGMSEDIDTNCNSPHTISIPDVATSSSSADPPSPVWDWGDGDINEAFDEASFLEILGNAEELANGIRRTDDRPVDSVNALKEDSLLQGSQLGLHPMNDATISINSAPAIAAAAVVASNMKIGGVIGNGMSMGIVKQKAPKKRMLEISASASLKAEAVAKSKELILQAKREMAKRTRIRRKKPKKRRVVVEQKLVELIRMIRMCKRVKAHTTDLFERSSDSNGTGLQSIKSITSYKMRVVSLAIEAFLHSFMFVQPSEHEYIFQLVRPISESCTLSVPALSSLVTEAKNVLQYINCLNCPDVFFNTLPATVPSKFYGFSEILRASEIFGDVIRFLLNSSVHLVPDQSLPGATPPAFTTNLAHSNAAVSLVNDRITVPFFWKSTGLSKDLELRGMVSCKIANELVVSITLHFDPFCVIRQSVPIACDIILKCDDKGSFHPSYFGF